MGWTVGQSTAILEREEETSSFLMQLLKDPVQITSHMPITILEG